MNMLRPDKSVYDVWFKSYDTLCGFHGDDDFDHVIELIQPNLSSAVW